MSQITWIQFILVSSLFLFLSLTYPSSSRSLSFHGRNMMERYRPKTLSNVNVIGSYPKSRTRNLQTFCPSDIGQQHGVDEQNPSALLSKLQRVGVVFENTISLKTLKQNLPDRDVDTVLKEFILMHRTFVLLKKQSTFAGESVYSIPCREDHVQCVQADLITLGSDATLDKKASTVASSLRRNELNPTTTHHMSFESEGEQPFHKHDGWRNLVIIASQPWKIKVAIYSEENVYYEVITLVMPAGLSFLQLPTLYHAFSGDIMAFSFHGNDILEAVLSGNPLKDICNPSAMETLSTFLPKDTIIKDLGYCNCPCDGSF
mmetsp:Transcript_18202/g.27321  ORF Transcript_18202/g.27321 Transcript_18202/m.27321 type:complete len:317 (-) Transcript_18202:19-969(-)